MKGAGILFVSLNGTALFLKRRPDAPDCPNCWDFPGGGAEGDETSEECAVRETREEIGFLPEGDRKLHTRTMGSTLKGVAGLGAPTVSIPVTAGAPTPTLEPQPAIPIIPPDVDFSTFIQRVTNEFTPSLNDEHVGWCWAPLKSPPEPLHPGCQIAIDRITMDEVGVAKAIADGRLTSPQRYENMMLWAIRISGTGASYRPKAGEYVFRDAENHLSPDALARMNGLPVILRHPEKALLNSKEFRKRIVGTILLPYVAGDEAWGIARIYDDEANAEMLKGASTSPGVNFDDFSVNTKLTIEEGQEVLIEGKPSLYDHVAICTLGVWDKGGDPTGIRSESREDSVMDIDEKAKKDAEEKAKQDAARKDAEEKEKADKAKKDEEEKAKKDADAGKVPDTNLSHVLDAIKGVADSVSHLTKRMDAIEDMEKHKKDKKDADDQSEKEKAEAEKTKADKAKKDADEKEEKEKKEREDAARRDSVRADSVSKETFDRAIAAVREELMGKIPTDRSDEDRIALAEAQERCDDAFVQNGKQRPVPQAGETVRTYERRCVRMLMPFSKTWKDVGQTHAFADDGLFSQIRDQVYKEAIAHAADPANAPANELRMVEKKMDGHIRREFHGDPRTWMNPIAGDVQLRATGSFLTPNRAN